MSFAPPPPPLGLVVAAGPTALGGLPQPPPPPIRMVGVPPGAMMKRPLQVLLTNVPPFLHGARPMRSWALAGGGGVRSIVMVPPPPILKPGETLKTIGSPSHEKVRISALLTMSHADAALKVITAFRHFQQKLKDGGQDEEYLNFTAHSVPTNPDIPLPPAVMDKETVTVLGDKLYEAFQQLKEGKETDQQASVNLTTVNDNSNTAKTISMDENSSNIRSSSTAEDGGDEGDDPLTTPTILEAVRKFREQLSLQQGSKAIRRQQLVKEAIEKALPVVRQRLQEERAATSEMPVIPGLPPPPDAGLPLPPPPPPPAVDGPRGVSNKPAWMTQQQQAQDTTEEPHAKKIKLDLSDSTIVFSAVRAESVDILRAFVAEKIRQYLGQEEADLIDFVHKHVLEQKSVSALQSDLADVLEEDAPAFLQAIYEKSQELS
jgi:hypothetical protein